MKQLSHSNAQFITKKNIISLQRESNLLYLIWIIFKLVLTKKLQFYLKKTMKKQKKFRMKNSEKSMTKKTNLNATGGKKFYDLKMYLKPEPHRSYHMD
jgi:pantothenate kinase